MAIQQSEFQINSLYVYSIYLNLAHLNETFYKSVTTRHDSLLLSKPRSDFKIWIDINKDTVIKQGKLSSAGVMIHLKRDGLGLLLGSFYVPTGIFAVLAMTSYVINPDAVRHATNWFESLTNFHELFFALIQGSWKNGLVNYFIFDFMECLWIYQSST